MGAVTSQMNMSVEQWIKVADNPIQRDTEKHAAKAKHLLTPLPTHQFVFAAQLPGGGLIKLDGHTRALLWERGQVVPPTMVRVGIIQVKDKAEAEALYKTFDSTNALETLRDKISGAFHRFNFEPQSGILQAGYATTALRMAYGILLGGSIHAGSAGINTRSSKVAKKAALADVYEMVNEFSPELTAFDGFGLKIGSASAGIMAAFFLSFRKYGHKVTPFWTSYFGNAGTKIDGRMDAVQALYEFVNTRNKLRYGGTAGYDLCSRALTAVEKWRNDETMGTFPRPMDVRGYLDGYEKPVERLIKKADARLRR